MAKCVDCDLPYGAFGLDTTLPDEQWLLIHPEEGTDLLCANCIARRAEKLEGTIAIRATIDFGCVMHESKAREYYYVCAYCSKPSDFQVCDECR